MPVVIPPFNTVPAPNDDVKSAWAQQLTQYAVDHVNDTNDAHDASAISFVPTGSIAASNVQLAIQEVATEAAAAAVAEGDKGDIEVTGGLWIVQDGVITNTKIADGAVTAPKIADGAVGTAKLADVSVVTAKLQDMAVTNAKLGPLNQWELKGRDASGAGAPQNLAPPAVRTLLASDSGGGTAKFLRADGTWAAPVQSTGLGFVTQAKSTSTTVATQSNIDITGTTVTWTADPTRRYKITVNVHHLQNNASAISECYIHDGAATLLLAITSGPGGNIAMTLVGWGMSGLQTRKLQGRCVSGSTSFYSGATILVEDIGAAP